MGTLVFLVCPCFYFRNSFSFSPEIPDLDLGIFDLGWVQVAEILQKSSKIVM
tara:strand:- start:92 stop:247 length:156 start_codon:yes stop_codon:yes gene_type:complete